MLKRGKNDDEMLFTLPHLIHSIKSYEQPKIQKVDMFFSEIQACFDFRYSASLLIRNDFRVNLAGHLTCDPQNKRCGYNSILSILITLRSLWDVNHHLNDLEILRSATRRSRIFCLHLGKKFIGLTDNCVHFAKTKVESFKMAVGGWKIFKNSKKLSVSWNSLSNLYVRFLLEFRPSFMNQNRIWRVLLHGTIPLRIKWGARR